MDNQKKIEVLDSMDSNLDRIADLGTDLINIEHQLERIADAIETIADNTKFKSRG